MSENSFFPGKPAPPEFLIGHEYEIAISFDQIYQQGHLAIWGGPGIGKSSFLGLLASSQVWEENGLDPSKVVIAMMDCDNIHPFTPSGFWWEVLNAIKNAIKNQLNGTALETEIQKIFHQGEVTKDDLNQILLGIGREKKFLLLLVDNFDVALRENEEYTKADMQRFLSECRSLAVASPGGRHLSMVVTSLKRLNELGPKLNSKASPWYNHYLFVQLKPFKNPEIEELLGKVRMTLELREAIKEVAGGNPHLLQIAGFLLYRQRQIEIGANRHPDVEQFINHFQTSTQQIYQIIWERCSEIEQDILMLVALFDLKGRLHQKKRFDLSNLDLIFTQRERELKNLEEQGVIIYKQEDKKIVYSFASSMMQKWVIQEVWNTDNPFIEERERVLIQLISHKQLDQIKLIWEEKDQIISTIEWFGKLVAAFPKGFI